MRWAEAFRTDINTVFNYPFAFLIVKNKILKEQNKELEKHKKK